MTHARITRAVLIGAADGGTTYVWEPQCSELPEPDRIDLDITKEEDGDCAFTSYPQLREALLIYYDRYKSSPAGKYVRQNAVSHGGCS